MDTSILHEVRDYRWFQIQFLKFVICGPIFRSNISGPILKSIICSLIFIPWFKFQFSGLIFEVQFSFHDLRVPICRSKFNDRLYESHDICGGVNHRRIWGGGVLHTWVITIETIAAWQNWNLYRRTYITVKIIFPFPFILNGIWIMIMVTVRFHSVRIDSSIRFKIERKTVTTIISHSIWKDMEI